MKVNIGFIKSESQVILKNLDIKSNDHTDEIINVSDITRTNINLLIYPNDELLSSTDFNIEKEEKFYPIISAESINLTENEFNNMNLNDSIGLYQKVISRWVLNNNIHTIEEMGSLFKYYRDLWSKDRYGFFEELWYILKTNLATLELSIIFNDINEESSEKNEKVTLKSSICKGFKTPEIFDCNESENLVFKAMKEQIGNFIEVNNYNEDAGELVFSFKIGLSPILVMTKLGQFNQLQKAIITGLISGIQQTE